MLKAEVPEKAEDGGQRSEDGNGGDPTPDEPTVFSIDSLRALVREHFDVTTLTDNHPPHSVGRLGSLRLVARKIPGGSAMLDKAQILRAYEARLA